MRRVVVFPLPLEPRIEKNSPWRMASSTESTAGSSVLGYRLETPSSWTITSLSGVAARRVGAGAERLLFDIDLSVGCKG
jgi:hypothetical protein